MVIFNAYYLVLPTLSTMFKMFICVSVTQVGVTHYLFSKEY